MKLSKSKVKKRIVLLLRSKGSVLKLPNVQASNSPEIGKNRQYFDNIFSKYQCGFRKGPEHLALLALLETRSIIQLIFLKVFLKVFGLKSPV